MVFGRHRPSEVDRTTGNVRVNIDTARKYNHPRCVDHAATVDRRYKVAAIVDAKIFDDAVDSVRRIVNFSARDSKHRLPAVVPVYPVIFIICGWLPSGNQNGFLEIASLSRRTTSSSVGYGDLSAGFSGIGISSIRYAVPGAEIP